MDHDALVEVLHRVVMGSVAMTVSAVMHANAGRELTLTQWRAILVVGEDEAGCRVGEVAQRVLGSVPATSRLLRRLEARGFMTLERDASDRRATRARLTSEGRTVRESVLAYRRDQLGAIARTVNVEHQARVVLNEIATEFDALA